MASYEGHLDGAGCDGFAGWAVDFAQLNVSISVTIFIDGNAVGTVLANGYRSDIAAHAGDNGLHGFFMEFPAQYKNGSTHTVTARYAGSNQELYDTPRTVNCPGSGTPPTTTPPTNPNPTTPTSLNPYNGDAYFINGVVGIGTTNVGDRSALLSVKGKIRAQEIRVELGNWPDYVFAPGYRLRPLSSVETYLKKYHHLPNMPAAAEIEQQGAALGDLNKRLVRQVEELTLHVIRLEKQVRQQRVRPLANQATHANQPRR